MLEQIQQQFNEQFSEETDLYQLLNGFRIWVNDYFVNYEVFLEDQWIEDKVFIKYNLCCLDTNNVLIIAEDEYTTQKRQDEQYLNKYIRSYWIIEPPPWNTMERFFNQNHLPRIKNADDGQFSETLNPD